MTLTPKAATALERMRAAGWAGLPFEQIGRGGGKVHRSTIESLERHGLAVYIHDFACFSVGRSAGPVATPIYGSNLTVPGSFRWVTRDVLDATLGAEAVAAAFKEGGHR